MYILLTIACLLSIVQVNGLRKAFFFDGVTYNPCGTKAGLFFYPHQTDYHTYYQCDENGIAYLRSCGFLVWDELRVACNWPSRAAPPSPIDSTTETTSSLPTTTSSLPTTTSSWPTTTSSWSSTTTESSSTTDAPSSSLCTPINPCGERGKCVESPETVPHSARRFACICSEDWFGRLCDKPIDELTTPPTMMIDQNNNIVSELNQTQKKTSDDNIKEEINDTTPSKKIF